MSDKRARNFLIKDLFTAGVDSLLDVDLQPNRPLTVIKAPKRVDEAVGLHDIDRIIFNGLGGHMTRCFDVGLGATTAHLSNAGEGEPRNWHFSLPQNANPPSPNVVPDCFLKFDINENLTQAAALYPEMRSIFDEIEIAGGFPAPIDMVQTYMTSVHPHLGGRSLAILGIGLVLHLGNNGFVVTGFVVPRTGVGAAYMTLSDGTFTIKVTFDGPMLARILAFIDTLEPVDSDQAIVLPEGDILLDA